MEVNEREIEEELDELTGEEDFDEAFDEALAEFSGEDGEEEETEEEPADSPENEGPKDEFELEKYVEAKNRPEEEAIPHGWAEGNQKLQDSWKDLPADVKNEIKRRESDRTRFMQREVSKTQELQKEIGPLADVAKELAPISERWALEDKPLSIAEGIRQGVALREYIKNAPKLALAKQFLKAAGATPEDLIESPQDARSEEIATLREEINSLKMNTESRPANQQDAAESQRAALSAKVMQRYYNFAETLNVNGQPKYPSARLKGFADAMGSQIARRVQQAPDTPVDEHIKAVYVDMGGQILDGSEIRYSNNNTQQLKEAATSGYSKGRGSTPSPSLYDNYDDAFNATLEEFGLLDE